jgi:hypothetical protein
MSNDGATGRRRVLHIVETVGSFGRQLEDALASTQAESKRVPDVYRGLAFLSKSPRAQVDAVVLGLDALEAGDLDFLPLAKRVRPDVPLFVYGVPHAAEAVAAGARHVASVDDILAGLRRNDAPVASVPARPQIVEEQTPVPLDTDLEDRLNDSLDEAQPDVLEVTTERINGGRRDVTPAEAEEPVTDVVKESATERPPVPWAPSSRRPQRGAPGSASPPPPTDEADDRPLLTDEEIRALLGQDATDASETG